MTNPSDVLHPSKGRWTLKRKADLVQAVHAGKLTLVEVVDAGISIAEFVGWERAFKAHGRDGLRVTVKLLHGQAHD
jgi:hypothetical protein